MYFDDLFKAVELWREGHATNQQRCSHVREAHHHLLGLSLYLNGQLPGGCQYEGHRTCRAESWFLKVNKQQLTWVVGNSICYGLIIGICKEQVIRLQ